jgi:hypothetical protein
VYKDRCPFLGVGQFDSFRISFEPEFSIESQHYVVNFTWQSRRRIYGAQNPFITPLSDAGLAIELDV